MRIAWGRKVSKGFLKTVVRICRNLGIDPSFLMSCIAFETAETFSSSIKNAAGSGAVGLIQFMPSTAAALGTTTEILASMEPEDQLLGVFFYFERWAQRLKTLEDVYMVILWPGAVGTPDDYVLFDRADPEHPIRYIQNAGLDFNRDGKITKHEAAERVRRKLEKGLRPEFALEL